MANTPNINLIKPIVGGDNNDWGGYLNDDMDRIDAVFAAAGTGTSVGLNVGAGKTLKIDGTISSTSNIAVSGPATITANSTDPALKITQTGAGHALYVEDQSSDPSPSLVVNPAGLVGVGTANPQSLLDVYVASGAVQSYVRTAGTTINDTSNVIAQAGTYSVQNVAYGSGQTYTVSNPIDYFRIGTSTNTGISFFTNNTEKLYLSASGTLNLGGSSNPAVSFYNQKTLSGSEVYANYTLANLSSNVTSAFSYRSSLSPAANATPYTVSGIYHYSAFGGTNGSNSSVVSQYGFLAGFNLTNSTNSFGFFGDIPAGDTRWNIYMNGSAKNYFAGNVGIGTTDPATKLHVVTADNVTSARISGASYAARIRSNSSSGMYIDATDTGEVTYQPIFVGGSTTTLTTSGTPRLNIASNGNVGIGTSAPAYQLDVYKASGSLTSFARVAGTTGSDVVQTGTMAGNFSIVSTVYGTGEAYTLSNTTTFFQVGTTTAAPYTIATSNTPRLTVSSVGYVGIGTTTPGNNLDVVGGIRTSQNYEMSGSGFVYSYAGGASGQVRSGINFDGSNQKMSFYTGTNIRAAISSVGNFGIGTSDPQKLLHVVSNDSALSFVRFAGASYAVRFISSSGVGMVIDATSEEEATYEPMYIGGSQVALTTSGNARLFVSSAGNVGIGTTSPSSKLDVVGTANITSSVAIGGAATITGATTMQSTASVDGNLSFNSGYGSAAVAYGCRAWVNFDGTNLAIRASGNIASITRVGTGIYTVTLTTAMPDANYSVNVTTSSVNGYHPAALVQDLSVSSFKVSVSDVVTNSFGNPSIVNVSVFR